MDPNRTPGVKLFEQVVKIKAEKREKEPNKPAESSNKVPDIVVLKSYREWTSVAHLEIGACELTEEGLTLRFSITGDPRYMAQPSDLIAICLETPPTERTTRVADTRLMAAVIDPTWDHNHWEITIFYNLDQLVKALKVPTDVRQKPSAKTISDAYTEIGVRAQWLGIMGGDTSRNGVRHESGGLDQKGGSGKVRLRPYTEQELRETETRRNTSWNMGEKLSRNRPVFQAYGQILQGDKEMLTTLECESEFKLSTEQELDKVISAMHGLSQNPELRKALNIVEMEAETKKYTDTYYDLPSPCDLLARRIVLRRRARKTDEPGTFLFSLKGATYQDGRGGRLRLAAQVQLKEAAFKTALLRKFLSDDIVDNAISRTLKHALISQGAKAAITRLENEDIAQALEINSIRETFVMKLPDGTQIDFSADKATSGSFTVYTFEFGLGHPALTQAATTGATVSTAEGSEKKPSVKEMVAQYKAPKAQIIRPYHVPADLENPAMFGQADYKKFVEIRDTVIAKVFGLDPATLELGGTKAYDLALKLGLIK